MEWYDDYNIDVELIDKQHQELVKVVSRLQQSLSSGAINTEIASTLKFLVQYTQQHFHDEEQLMRSIAFSELENHQRLHGKLIAEIKDILIGLKKGKSVDHYDLIDFLTNWLINHIRYEDKKIGRAMELYRKKHNDWDGSFA